MLILNPLDCMAADTHKTMANSVRFRTNLLVDCIRMASPSRTAPNFGRLFSNRPDHP